MVGMLRDTGTCASIVFVSESRVEKRVEGKVESRSRGIHINVTLLSAVLTFILNQIMVVLYTKRRKSITSERIFSFLGYRKMSSYIIRHSKTLIGLKKLIQKLYNYLSYNRRNSNSYEKESKTLFQIQKRSGSRFF
jgi:hypothetical protein